MMMQVPARSRHNIACSVVSRQTDRLERIVDAIAAGELLDLRDWVAVFRVDGVGRAELFGPLQLAARPISTAMIVVAPASLAPLITLSPTPPQPKTATLEPGFTPAE